MTDQPSEASFDLVDTLLYATSHDLKSPLLTLSLSADLLMQGVPDDVKASSQTALEGLKHGSVEIERMLDALAIVSRAYRRQLDATPVALADALLSTTHDLAGVEQWNVAADAQAIAQLLTILDGLGDTALAISDETLVLSSVQPASDYDLHPTPVETLFSSLTAHAATSVQALAEVQVQLMRQGGSISFEDGRTVARVPLARKQ